MIPKVIHYFWLGKRTIPKSDLQNIETWKKYCPDYEIKFWNEDNYQIPEVAYVQEAYNHENWAHVSDYARLDVLYQYGGIYFDTDVELLKPLDDLLKFNAFLGFEDDFHVNTGQGIGAEPRNPVIKLMMDDYRFRSFVNTRGQCDMTPSPVINTECLVRNGFVQDNSQQQVIEMEVYPKEYFCPKNMETGKIHVTENTYSIHHYNASWYTSKMRKQQKRCKCIRAIFGLRIGHWILSMIVCVGKIRLEIMKRK